MRMANAVAVIGGINLDLKGWPHGRLRPATSNPGEIAISPGGVGRNIAHNLALLGVPVALFGAVGDDVFGARVLADTRAAGVDVSAVRVVSQRATGLYLSILNETHDLAVALSAMDITRGIDRAYLRAQRARLCQSRLIVADTNLDADVLGDIVNLSHAAGIPCLINPVSIEKTQKLFTLTQPVDYVTPNRLELEALCGQPITQRESLHNACAALCAQYRAILVTLGAEGVYAYWAQTRTGGMYPALPTTVVDPNGAGDAFIAGFVAGVAQNLARDVCIRLGIAAAHLTLQSADTVARDLSFERCLALTRT